MILFCQSAFFFWSISGNPFHMSIADLHQNVLLRFPFISESTIVYLTKPLLIGNEVISSFLAITDNATMNIFFIHSCGFMQTYPRREISRSNSRCMLHFLMIAKFCLLTRFVQTHTPTNYARMILLSLSLTCTGCYDYFKSLPV